METLLGLFVWDDIIFYREDKRANFMPVRTGHPRKTGSPALFCDDNHLVNVCHDCSKGVIKRYTKNNTGVDVNRYINSV